MKIVYISSSTIPSRTANSIHVMKMCQAFAKNGHEVVLLAPDRKAEYEPGVDYEYYGVEKCFEIVRIPWLPLKGRGFFYGFIAARKAKKLNPDLVYCRNAPGCYFATKLDLPVVLESHAPIEDAGKIFEWMFRKIIENYNCCRLVVITNALKFFYEKNYFAARGKIQVSPDGADPIPPDIEPVVLPNAGQRLQVGYVGHLYKGKGLEVVSQLGVLCPWVDFHVVGGTANDIAYWMDKNRQHQNIFFHGHVPHSETVRFLIGFDVLLLPNQEIVSVHGKGKQDIGKWTSPLKAFEYMSSKKPIISSDLPVLREVFQNERNALLCKPENLSSWVSALERIRDDRALSLRLAEKAYGDFIMKYTWSVRAEKVIGGVDDSLE